MSETKNLEAAFLKAQAKFTSIPKNAKNEYFKSKYATLDDLVDGVKTHLNSEGLSFRHTSRIDGEKYFIGTQLFHAASGQSSPVFEMQIPVGEPQKMGSGITYARRYSLAALLGVPSDEDDDGNDASGKTVPAPGKPNAPSAAPNQNVPRRALSEAQLKRLFAIAKSHGVELPQVDGLLSLKFGIKSKNDLTKDQYDYVCSLIESNKFFEAYKILSQKKAPEPVREDIPQFDENGFPF